MISSERGARRSLEKLPGPARLRATLAQLVERLIRNQQVAGSIPAGGSIKINKLNKSWIFTGGTSGHHS